MRPLSSKRVYEVWTQMVQDEPLYEAMLAGTHASLTDRHLDEEAIEILNRFRAEPGTRWNVENLRFRASLFVGDTLLSYMPRTIALLTSSKDDWRQDLCFEYLAYHKWTSLGHMMLSECERFGAFVKDRIMKRRQTPPHLPAVLSYELAVVGLLRSTCNVPASAWDNSVDIDPSHLDSLRPRRSPVQHVIELDVDLRPWIESGDPSRGDVRPGPITLLLYVPSLEEKHQIKVISEGVRIVLQRCDGERSLAALAKDLEDEFGLSTESVQHLVLSLVREKILRV